VAATGLAVLGLGISACGTSGSSSTAASSPSTSATIGATSGTTTSGTVVAAASTSLGTVLVDSTGRTIYQFAVDSPGVSRCTGSCLTYWPIVTAPKSLPKSIPGVGAELSSIQRSDGSRQLTVNGWPMYTYAGDTAPGMTAGQGLNASGGLWWVMSPDGQPITTAVSSAPSPSTSHAVGY
jgi:predicted lipoprotein with Yx(FWY)xxD motif